MLRLDGLLAVLSAGVAVCLNEQWHALVVFEMDSAQERSASAVSGQVDKAVAVYSCMQRRACGAWLFFCNCLCRFESHTEESALSAVAQPAILRSGLQVGCGWRARLT